MKSADSLRARVQIDTPLGYFLGESRIRLLEAIQRHGSIARAARAVRLGYRAAWEAVDDMNNLSPQPLVARSVSGGARGGGTQLTPYAEQLIAFFRALESAQQTALKQLQPVLDAACAGGSAGDVSDFQQILRRFAMLSSARNQFVGQVLDIRQDGIEAEVRVEISPGLSISAVVTSESVERLGLVTGAETQVLVKSSSVMLTPDPTPAISARNCLRCRVLRLRRGSVNSEVLLELTGSRPGHSLQLTSVITDASATRLNLQAGQDISAFFKASNVLLAVMR